MEMGVWAEASLPPPHALPTSLKKMKREGSSVGGPGPPGELGTTPSGHQGAALPQGRAPSTEEHSLASVPAGARSAWGCIYVFWILRRKRCFEGHELGSGSLGHRA